MSRSSLCFLRDSSFAVRRSSPDVAGCCSRSRRVARVFDDAHRAAGKGGMDSCRLHRPRLLSDP